MRALPALALCVALIPRPTHACPCIALADSQANEVAQRSMVIVESDALTYVLQLAVEGNATELGWLIPTPAVPDDPTLTDASFFAGLDASTEPFLWQCGNDSDGCSDALNKSGSVRQNSFGDTTVVWSSGTLDNLEYAVLSATDGSDLLTWLSSNNYPVDSSLQAVVDDYVAREFAFVAVRVSGDALAGELDVLGPIVVRVPYTGDPVLPLAMTALGGGERLSLLVYVAARNVMGPSNYPTVTIDGDALRADESGNTNYPELLADAVAASGGAGFVVEWADTVGSGVFPEELRNQLWGKQIVRLHTEVAPGELGEDLELVPQPGLSTPSYDCVPGPDEGGGCAVVTGPLTPILLLLGVGLALRRRR